jgi:hypothetical protein
MTEAKVEVTFTQVCERSYVQQAQFFLNAFWLEHKGQAEEVWEATQGFKDLDLKGDAGCRLDEFYSHKFLESFGETMTVIELRKKLREIDVNLDGQMSLIEYLINKFNRSVPDLMSRPQGTNEELAKAQLALEEVQKQIKHIESEKARLEAESKGTGVKAKTVSLEFFSELMFIFRLLENCSSCSTRILWR